MAQRVRIQCVNKSDRTNPHERIKSIGGSNHDRTPWKLAETDAISGIEHSKWSFYVERPQGHVVEVVIARSPYGNKYLKTEADGEQPNNLLALPECP
jgi:Protein of unknown function (DUF3892)